MKDRRKFLAAVLLAALFGIDRFGFASCIRALWNILLALTARQKNRDPVLGAKRRDHCEQCVIFWSPLRTCGSPLADDPALGCWCAVDKTSPDPKAECWADTATDMSIGWKSAGL